MTVAYADQAALDAFTPLAATLTPSEAARLLQRASELVDDKVRAAYAIDTGTSLPTDTDVATALSDATCAQVEFWLEVGEEHDTGGMANRQVAIGHLSVDRLPPELAPRAFRLMHAAGLLSAGWLPAGWWS